MISKSTPVSASIVFFGASQGLRSCLKPQEDPRLHAPRSQKLQTRAPDMCIKQDGCENTKT